MKVFTKVSTKIAALLVFYLAITAFSCGLSPTVLTVAYAFRAAEHSAMTSPLMQAKITNVATQTKINTFEGDFDTAWNCMMSAYEKASTGVPAGQPVNVDLSSFSPCAANAWGAAFQIISTVRAVDPTFLNTAVTYNLSNGTQVVYDPAHFASSTPPALPPVPVSGTVTTGGAK